MPVKTVRRHYLLKRLFAAQSEQADLASVWRSKQEAQPGTPLPATFPFISELARSGYTTVTDLDGADCDELQRTTSLSDRDARAVFEALAPLF